MRPLHAKYELKVIHLRCKATRLCHNAELVLVYTEPDVHNFQMFPVNKIQSSVLRRLSVLCIIVEFFQITFIPRS